MIYRNYKKSNPYKQALDKFSDENRLMSFGVVKNFVTGRYKWLASYMFKGRNNTQTNKHRAFIGWFSDVEMNLNEYGNVDVLQSYPYFERNERPKFPQFYTELSSKQYKRIGQEYAEYDTIEHVDLSGLIEIPYADIGVENILNVFHKFGDIPAFVCSGYKIPDIDNAGKYIYLRENPQVQVNLNFNDVEILLNDNKSDPLNIPEVIAYLDTIYGEGINPKIFGYEDLENLNAVIVGTAELIMTWECIFVDAAVDYIQVVSMSGRGLNVIPVGETVSVYNSSMVHMFNSTISSFINEYKVVIATSIIPYLGQTCYLVYPHREP